MPEERTPGGREQDPFHVGADRPLERLPQRGQLAVQGDQPDPVPGREVGHEMPRHDERLLVRNRNVFPRLNGSQRRPEPRPRRKAVQDEIDV